MHLPADIHFHFASQCDSYLCWSYVKANAHQILGATGEQVTLALSSIVLGFLVAVPLSIFARGNKLRTGAVFGFSSALYAVPSLAFVVALYGVFGLGRLTIIIPVAAYSLVILTRNIITGLDEVPPEAIDAALGMGFSPAALLWRVRMPLAIPSIVAGLRIATVSSIELVVIGGYVGLGGYGYYLFDGLSDNEYKPEITTYLILTVLLALVADLLLLALQRPLTRWQRAGA